MFSDHPRRAFGGPYRCAKKFGGNRYSSFDNMQVLLFRDLGLKTPVHSPKIDLISTRVQSFGAVAETVLKI